MATDDQVGVATFGVWRLGADPLFARRPWHASSSVKGSRGAICPAICILVAKSVAVSLDRRSLAAEGRVRPALRFSSRRSQVSFFSTTHSTMFASLKPTQLSRSLLRSYATAAEQPAVTQQLSAPLSPPFFALSSSSPSFPSPKQRRLQRSHLTNGRIRSRWRALCLARMKWPSCEQCGESVAK